MCRWRITIYESQKRQTHWNPRNTKTNDRSLTAVRQPLTDVRFLTSLLPYMSNTARQTTHDTSRINTATHNYPNNRHKERHKKASREHHTHTPYGPHNLPHMVLCTKKDLIMPSKTKEIIEVTQLNLSLIHI